MQLLNSSNRYGLVSIVMHWLVALAVFALFGLGLWMTGLNYYSEWYRTAPALHKSVGVTLFALMLLRVLWRFFTPKPAPLSTHSSSERLLSRLGHGLLYLGIFVVMISGYLISTAEGRGISVFDLFEIPALISGLPNQADLAGAVHFYVAWGLVIFAGLHALAALKHHFIDRDATLKRMLGYGPK
ncbi:cytochrome b [Pseudomonas sp. C27(2019)]|uniref:cytochrome b n=1 Tax=Pseudomonas sp. C27(2019) TaxID=2604941 RepID=UPI0012465998|nr:cytochrome b [Pseudomonas sp. C27(2019)]QEY60297.1 cytochrome b [Pseudomonas sp. C27(2019)]